MSKITEFQSFQRPYRVSEKETRMIKLFTILMIVLGFAVQVWSLELNAGLDEKNMNSEDADQTTALMDLSQETRDANRGSINLKRVLELGGQNLLHICNPEKNYLPYFIVREAGGLGGDHAWNHNIGRWWDAMLRLEEATGFKIPAEREKIMVENLRKFCENPDNLPFGPRDNWLGIQPDCYVHSFREYILAVNSLVRYRHSKWAAELGHKMLESIGRASNPDGTLTLRNLDTYAKFYKPNFKDAVCPDGTDDNCPHGITDRAIEALVWYYQATGDPLALKLADRFARYHLQKTTHPDGSLNMTSRTGYPNGHTHSYLGGLRGLFLYGKLTRQHEYIDVVKATYEVTVRRIVRESGYANHNLEETPEKVTSIPEISSPGDAAQLALWLGLQTGRMEYLDDAERWVRSRIVPGQIPEKYSRDGKGNLDLRMLGGWGAYNHPQGAMMSYTDVTAAVLHSLCDIYKHIAVRDESGLMVYFHFDYEDENVRISSERADEAKLKIIPKKQDNVLVRIPKWTPANSVRLTVSGESVPVKMMGNFAFIERVKLPQWPEIILRYGLPVKTTTETINGVDYRYTWRGDEITGAYPNTTQRPIYPTIEDGP